jgi:hypothetical protein
MEETSADPVFNPLVYAWGLVPVLQLASGFLISSAWSDAYTAHNAVSTTDVDLSVSDTAWSTLVMLNYIEGAAGLALFGAGVAVGGPAGLAFLWGSRFWILASAVNSYLAFSNNSCTGTAGVAAVAGGAAAVTAVASTNDCLGDAFVA